VALMVVEEAFEAVEGMGADVVEVVKMVAEATVEGVGVVIEEEVGAEVIGGVEVTEVEVMGAEVMVVEAGVMVADVGLVKDHFKMTLMNKILGLVVVVLVRLGLLPQIKVLDAVDHLFLLLFLHLLVNNLGFQLHHNFLNNYIHNNNRTHNNNKICSIFPVLLSPLFVRFPCKDLGNLFPLVHFLLFQYNSFLLVQLRRVFHKVFRKVYQFQCKVYQFQCKVYQFQCKDFLALLNNKSN